MGKFLRARLAVVGRTDEPRDAGMTLIELMFALVIFAIVAAGAMAGITGALTTTRSVLVSLSWGEALSRTVTVRS